MMPGLLDIDKLSSYLSDSIPLPVYLLPCVLPKGSRGGRGRFIGLCVCRGEQSENRVDSRSDVTIPNIILDLTEQEVGGG